MASSLLPCLFPLQEGALDKLRGTKQIIGSGLLGNSGVKAALVISSNPSLVLQAALTPAHAGKKVVVVMGGERWTRLPPSIHLMPSPSSASMSQMRFWYPANLTELTQLIYKEDVAAESLIVSDADLLVRRSMGGLLGGKTFLKTFARLSALLHSYLASCLGEGSKDLMMANMVVFSSFSAEEEKEVTGRASLWYQEIWKEEQSPIRNQLISVPGRMSLSYHLSEDSYYLQGLEI